MAGQSGLVNLAVQAARAAGIDPNTFVRQIRQESGFNPNARSPAGALGIAQFMPATAREYGVNPLDPRSALFGAARYMARLQRQYGSPARALSAYNSGNPNAYLDPHFAGGQTFNYVRSILAGGAGGPVSVGRGGSSAAGAVAPGAPRAPRGQQQRGINPALLSVINQGNEMFGLPALPDVTPVKVPRQQVGPVPASRPANPVGVGTYQASKGGSSIRWIEHLAAPFGLTVTSTTGGKHAPGSYHYKGRAVDLSGDPGRMAALARFALQHANTITEMFYTGPGSPGYFIKNGRVYPNSQLDRGLYAEHTNHVHLAR